MGSLHLVYFGVTAPPAATGGSLGVAAAYPVVPTLAVWIFRATSSAHLNPAVTLALAVRAGALAQPAPLSAAVATQNTTMAGAAGLGWPHDVNALDPHNLQRVPVTHS